MTVALGRSVHTSPVAGGRRAREQEALGMDPTSRRVHARTDVPVPLPPSQEMTAAELTHAFQHMSAQTAEERTWCSKAE